MTIENYGYKYLRISLNYAATCIISHAENILKITKMDICRGVPFEVFVFSYFFNGSSLQFQVNQTVF